MIDNFYIKENDLQPYYYAGVKDSDGDVVDITGASIKCTMKHVDGTIKINRQDTGINISDGTNGKFEYKWQSGDTDATGKYYIEFEIDPSASEKFTIPANPSEKAIVHIMPSLDES